MTQTTFSEFRNNAKKYFDAVEKKGDSIEIYRHGKPAAVLTPVFKKTSRWKQREPMILSGVNLSKAILEDREEKIIMHVYFDSSALVKLYVYEPGSKETLRFCEQADEIVLSCIAIPEYFSALNRRLREGKLKKKQYAELKKEFLLDIEEAAIIDISPAIIKTGIVCLEKTSLRTLDALHLASAEEASCDLFISADARQYAAAGKMNLKAVLIGKE